MANSKISALTAKTSFVDTDEFVLVDNASTPTTKKITGANLKASIPLITAPAAWTPTFTGFGTVSNVTAYSWRVGSELFYEIYFTSGTPTGVEARISLGFNGTDGNVTTASTYSTLNMVGFGGGSNSAVGIYCLAEASKTYITFGRLQSTSAFPLAKNLGTDFVVASGNYSVKGSVRIQGW